MVKATKTRARQSARTGSFEIFTYPQRSLAARILGLLWRWRVELLVLTVLVSVWAWLARHLPSGQALLVVLTVIIAVFALPVSRRFLVRRAWCVVSRHRVRKCFVQSRVMTHEGLLPLFIWTRPTPVGERLRVWLRPGLSSRDIASITDRIAAACWARDARVQVHTNRVSTVWVDVIRRDPLATGHITSPLLHGVPVVEDQDAEVIPLPDRTTVTTDGPDGPDGDTPPSPTRPAVARAATTKRTTTRTTPSSADSESAAAVLGWSGEDVSDYV